MLLMQRARRDSGLALDLPLPGRCATNRLRLWKSLSTSMLLVQRARRDSGLALGFPSVPDRDGIHFITRRCYFYLIAQRPGARECDARGQEIRRVFPEFPENGQGLLPLRILI